MPIEKGSPHGNPEMKHEKIRSPEEISEACFNDFINYGFNKQMIVKIREDLRSLQSPGKLSLEHKKRMITTYEGPSADERRLGGDVTFEVTTYYLRVGAKTFVVSSGQTAKKPEGSPEQIRDTLIQEKRRELNNLFENAKKERPTWIVPRSDLPDTEEWNRKFNARWDEMQQNLQTQWEKEDADFLTAARQSWEQYENASNELRSAQQEATQAEKRAHKLWIELNPFDTPSWGDIGKDTEDEMLEKAAALRAYAKDVDRYVAEVRSERLLRTQDKKPKAGETVKPRTEEKDMPLDALGPPGKLLDVARALAEEAERQLGTSKAKELFQTTYEANYGRARRQADIKDALREDLSENARRFYDFSKAKDVNTVLEHVLKMLGEGEIRHETEKSTDSVPQINIPESEMPKETQETEALPPQRLNNPDKKGWWFHELPSGMRHSEKLNKTDKIAFEAGDRITVRCASCPGSPVVGYLQK